MSWLRRTWPYLLVLLLAVLAIWFILSWSADADTATKPRKDSWPLHYDSRGPRVLDAKWLLVHNRHGIVTFRGDLRDPRYTLAAGEAAKKMRFKLGYTKQGRGFDQTLRSYLVPIKNGGKPLPKAYAKRKAQRRSDAWPLRYGSSGERVRDAKWLLAGHNKWHITTYHGKPGNFYSLDTAKASCEMKFRIGYAPSYFQDSGQKQIAICRRFGATLKGYLTGARKLPNALWRTRIKLRTPKPKPKPPTDDAHITRMVSAVRYSIRNASHLHYTQGGSRWYGIHSGLNVPPSFITWSDCSSFVTFIYWQEYRSHGDFLNGLSWSAGYTGTLAAHGRYVPASTAKPGDLVFYGYGFPFSHVAIVISGHGYGARIGSMGSEIGPLDVPMTYRPVAQVRRYVG